MSDPIRAAAERLLQQLTLPSGTPYAGQLLEEAERNLRAALATEPPAPDPHEALAVRPLLEAVAALEVYGNGPLPTLQQRISAWLAENPPGQPVAIEPRGCPAPGACSCVEPSAPDHLRGATEMAAHSARLRQCPTHGQQPAHTWGCPECLRELREELARVKATAADGDREELAYRLGWIAAQLADIGYGEDSASVARAAALLRQPAPAPAPVPVSDRPWEREGWCDAEGRCWWGRCSDEFFSPEWTLATRADIEDFCSDAMPQQCLPHWALPQPPQGGEVEA